MQKKTLLITGSAGFIGFHLALRLLKLGYFVIGIDRLPTNTPFDLTTQRNEILVKHPSFIFKKLDLVECSNLASILSSFQVSAVFHLAGTSNVQFSLDNPRQCLKNNNRSTIVLLEALRSLEHKPLLFFASSASVYGLSIDQPYNEQNSADTPMSMYAVTKRATEMMMHMYAKTYGIPSVAFRFFSVYGPWINPDLAPFKFVKNILEGSPIEVFNGGDMLRDFVYIEDVVDCMLMAYDRRTKPGSEPFEIFNIGSGSSQNVIEIVSMLEDILLKKANLNLIPHLTGRAHQTIADLTKIHSYCGFSPRVTLKEGLKLFCDWYLTWSEERTRCYSKISRTKQIGIELAQIAQLEK